MTSTTKTADETRHADLSFGEDARGDWALFIKRRHLLAPRNSNHFAALDTPAAIAAAGTAADIVFFRLLDDDGRELGGHGFLEDGGVVQWG